MARPALRMPTDEELKKMNMQKTALGKKLEEAWLKSDDRLDALANIDDDRDIELMGLGWMLGALSILEMVTEREEIERIRKEAKDKK
jgi:hypothetical protein